MKILYVVPYIPALNSNGGAWRMYAILKGMADRGHQVFVIGFANSEVELPLADPLKEFCQKVEIMVRRPVYSFSNFFRRGFLDNDFFMPAFEEKLLQLLKKENFDVVQYEYYQMADYIKKDFGKVILFSDYESPFLIEERRKTKQTNIISFFKHTALLARTAWVLQNVDTFIALTSNDADSLIKYFPSSKPYVLNTGVDTTYFFPNEKLGNPYQLIFIGYFLHTPNVEAMKYLVHEILPKVWQKEPKVKLLIVGKDPTTDIKALQSKNVEITGFVQDTRVYLKKSGIYVVPIISGAGLRGKILEAWSSEIPVVSTSIAADGLQIQNKQNIEIADNSDRFADSILELIHNPSLRHEIATNGRKTVEKFYSWKSKLDELELLYQTLLRRVD